MATLHQPAQSSGYKTATAQIVSGKNDIGNNSAAPGGFLHSIQLIPDGTNACTVTAYNSQSNTSGQELAFLSIAASTAAPTSITFNTPVLCDRGIRVVLSGSGTPSYIVIYSLGT